MKIIFCALLSLLFFIGWIAPANNLFGFENVNNDKNTNTLSRVDSMAIFLADIWSLDQGIREDVKMYSRLDKAFKYKMDSLCFNKAIRFIECFGWPTDIGKYNPEFGYLLQTLTAVMLHNSHRLMDSSVYQLLKNEVIENRLNPNTLSLFLDKYYVVYEKRTLYYSQFRKFLSVPFPYKADKLLSDSLRADIGLKSLPDSVFSNNIKML